MAAAQQRIRSLLDAVVAVGSDLDLQTVLHRIAEVAVSLVDASFGALGVISEDGRGLAQFLVVGVEDEMLSVIGQLPSGHGVLGQLIRDPRPLRLDNLADHPQSFGFPPGHPPMHTFLGVPIRVRDTVFGNLYLTEKRGGAAFDDEDEAIVLALATAAGIAIENARLYSDTRQRERWLQASSEISTALLSGTDPDDVLAVVATRAREVTGGTLAFVALPLDSERLLIEFADGARADLVRGRLIDGATGVIGQVLRDGRLQLLAEKDLPLDIGDSGAGMAVPLGAPDHPARGVLVVAGLPAAEMAVAVGTIGSFAAQAAVALELAERRRDVERFAVFEDRDRIARDLHDLVIQRLFATKMGLEGVVWLVDNPEAAGRIVHAVDNLDETIKDIRSAIFSLQTRDSATARATLRVRILVEVQQSTEILGFAPALRMEGLLDTRGPEAQAGQMLAARR